MKKFFKALNLKQALGEILIVIIGVSIAFLLDRWAESSRNDQFEIQYLQVIQLDLEDDLQMLSENEIAIGQKLGSMQKIFPHLGRPLPGRDSIPLLIFNLAKPVSFIQKDVTYQSMINSGDFRLIKDFDLRNSIEGHYNSYKVFRLDYERASNFNKTIVGQFFLDEIDYSKLYQGDVSFLDKPYLRNMLFTFQGILSLQLKGTQGAKAACEEMLEELEGYLAEE